MVASLAENAAFLDSAPGCGVGKKEPFNLEAKSLL